MTCPPISMSREPNSTPIVWDELPWKARSMNWCSRHDLPVPGGPKTTRAVPSAATWEAATWEGAQLEQRREWLGVGWPVLPACAPPKAAKRALRGAGAERGRSQGGTWTMVAAAVAPGDFVHAMDQSARAGSLRRPSCGTAPLGAALSKRLGLWAGGWPRRRVSRCEPGHFERAAAPVSPMMMSLKSRSKLSELGSIRDEPPSIAQPAGRSTRGGAR